jgi:ligand-binding sensor domain-containing protein
MRAWAIGLVVVMMVFGDSLNAYALDGHRRITQYAHAHFAARDGLPQSYVVAIAQTSDGYLWSSSQEGLSRFDGVGFKTFAHRTNKGIPSKAFTALAVDAAGSLWAGTRDRGVLHLVGGEFRPVAWQPGAREDWIRALAFDADGDLWIGTRGHGVVRLHDGVLTISLTTHDGLPSDDVRSFLVARDGTLWIGTFKGLVQWKAGRIARGPEELDGVTVHSIAQDAGGALWCATDKGLVRLRDDSIEPIDTDRLTPSQVRKLLFDRNGNLWIGTRTGVVRITFDGQAGRQIRGQIGGRSNGFRSPRP